MENGSVAHHRDDEEEDVGVWKGDEQAEGRKGKQAKKRRKDLRLRT